MFRFLIIVIFASLGARFVADTILQFMGLSLIFTAAALALKADL